jgi:uncharacterized NAD(P)/FAD-binding protein YdhS
MSNAGADVAIIGFGFSGLATLMQLVARTATRDIIVIADDECGEGLAYGTRDSAHLLNVQSNRMGAWAQDPGDFARWLASDAAADACRELAIPCPGPLDFAPRVLYARYLRQLREGCLQDARVRGITVRFLRARADRLTRFAGHWSIATTQGDVRARRCVLAIGHDRRRVFGAFRHPRLYEGPWQLPDAGLHGSDDPVALIGSGLTAIDSVLSLRRRGFDGQIVTLSRNGRLPSTHKRGVYPLELSPEQLSELRDVDAVVSFIRGAVADGHDWRSAFDALRPHTTRLWHGLSADERCEAVADWMSLWGVLRHRMAPEVGERIRGELRSGRLRVLATSRITPVATGDELELDIQERDGDASRLRCEAVIDCTGARLDVGRSDDPLRRSLIEAGTCTPHHTGLGLAADRHQQVADDLYAVGSLLTGELWESIAVPELRAQAALVAEQIAGEQPIRPPAPRAQALHSA